MQIKTIMHKLVATKVHIELLTIHRSAPNTIRQCHGYAIPGNPVQFHIEKPPPLPPKMIHPGEGREFIATPNHVHQTFHWLIS